MSKKRWQPPIGSKYRAVERYRMICRRVAETYRSRNACYQGIEVRFSREEFIEWFMPKDFDGCHVDRIESHGHYELGNIRVITANENLVLANKSAKRRRIKIEECPI